MVLTQQEITQFYKIWCALIWGVNEKHNIIPKFENPVYGEKSMSQSPFIAVRAELWDNPEWIDEFINDNEYGELTESDLGILIDWRKNFVKDRFVIMKHLKKYAIFMTMEEPVKLYGVCGISNPISENIPYGVPLMVDAILLPFKDKIIYDSLLAHYNLSFGKGMRDSLKSAFNSSKEKFGIIENMNLPPEPVSPSKKKPKKQKPAPPVVDTKGANVPNGMSARYMEVAEIIENFCDEKLNDEYKKTCLQALAKLCRKRPSPLLSSKARTWACGIVYAIGSNNYIFDKSQPLSITASDISGWFGLSKNTAGGKANEINKLLNIHRFNNEFILPSITEKSPMTWYLTVNGYFVDIRTMPREAQVVAYNKGLIPYIPADRIE